MTLPSLPFAAAGPSAPEGIVHETFEFGRIQSNVDLIIPVGVLLAIAAYVVIMYIRDAKELHPVLGCLLAALRLTVFIGLLIFFLQPRWRAEEEQVVNSKTVFLVDTSMSMDLPDVERPNSGPDVPSRIERVASVLQKSDFLNRLQESHDVSVMQFGEALHRDRVRLLPKLGSETATADDEADQPESGGASGDNGKPSEDGETNDKPFVWKEFLELAGNETRLGAALEQVIGDESDEPLAGIILISDGGQNAGVGPELAMKAAQKAGVPIFTIGMGSDQLTANVAVTNLVAPVRAYPNDRYVVTGYLRAERLAGKKVIVQLFVKKGSSSGSSAADDGELRSEQEVILGPDGELVPVKFELSDKEIGHRTLVLRMKPLPDDSDPKDNSYLADVEIVDRKNRVLLMAGGPMRDYRFLRTLLHRDDSVEAHVLLQSAEGNVSQEADVLLDDFPTTAKEMFEYDAVIAFDADWLQLDSTQIDLLERWVAEQAGGLIVVAGPVYTGDPVGGWVEASETAKIRALYPVIFQNSLFIVEERMYETANEPWPLEFTREGIEAEHLWLDDRAVASQQAWEEFEGVFGHCPVQGPKMGTTVLARFSDPRTRGVGDQLPIFLAEQFYGSGRVFYIGSGEMWRLRRHDVAYFERFYTKLVRHVSQGRLVRGSARGMLLVNQRDYVVGNTVEIRAQLTDPRMEPLATPEVAVQVFPPGGGGQSVTLHRVAEHPGTYSGQFTVLNDGQYRLELPIPESEEERLSQRINVSFPDLERDTPQRNDTLLSQIARNTEGKYYVGLETALGDTADSILAQLKDATTTTFLPLQPDPDEEQQWLLWVMVTLCSLLCLEWLIRRLSKLA